MNEVSKHIDKEMSEIRESFDKRDGVNKLNEVYTAERFFANSPRPLSIEEAEVEVIIEEPVARPVTAESHDLGSFDDP